MLLIVKKYCLTICIAVLLINSSNGQDRLEKEGTVSYISSQNIYVRFENAEGIFQGDTLYKKIDKVNLPAVKVRFISTSSAAGEKIGNQKISLNDKLTAFIILKGKRVTREKDSVQSFTAGTNNGENKSVEINSGRKYYKSSDPPVSGKLSIQSYTGLSNYTTFGDYQRWRYNFSLYAKNISGTKLSFSNYVSFSYKTSDWGIIRNNFAGNLRVYDFAGNYQFSKNSSLWFGRHLNSKITNISSIDGLQFESKINGSKYNYGFTAGSRPDFNNMGFNIKLFEFGGYISRVDTGSSGLMENTLALMQQTNNLIIDRRFLYFQHSSNLIDNLNLFLSSEIDLYKKEKGKGKNDFSLTGLYFSARYTPFKIISFLLSYDARKNVIYYETFKNFVETLIENETRQGFRGAVFLRPFTRLFINLNSGYRFSKGDLKPSRNYNGYISYSQIPFLDLTPSISVTKLLTSYADGTTAELRLSKDIDILNSNLSLSYQKVDYSFSYSPEKLQQNIFSSDIFIRLFGKSYLNFDYEGTFQKSNTDNRIIIGLTQRF